MSDKVTRWSGKPVATVQGVRIHVKQQKPKTEQGHRRLVINIRQDKPKRWRVSHSLAYTNSVDIIFAEVKSGD